MVWDKDKSCPGTTACHLLPQDISHLYFSCPCLQPVFQPCQHSVCWGALAVHNVQMRKLRQDSKQRAKRRRGANDPLCPKVHILPHNSVLPGLRNSSDSFSYEFTLSKNSLLIQSDIMCRPLKETDANRHSFSSCSFQSCSLADAKGLF